MTVDDMLNEYFDEGLSLHMCSAKYGRSVQTITREIRKAEAEGRVRTKQPIDRRSVANSPPLDRVHRRIGMRFTQWRTVENNYSAPEAARACGMSLNRLHTIEGGVYNWTLIELIYTCQRMGWNLIDLIRGVDLGNYFVPEPE